MEAPEMPVMPEVVEPPKKKTNVWLIVIIVLVVLCCCCVIAVFAGSKLFATQINDFFNSISGQIY